VAASMGAVAIFAACTSMGSSSSSSAPTPNYSVSQAAPTPDPRVGLAPGTTDSVVIDGHARRVIHTNAAAAGWNIKLMSTSPATGHFHGQTNSDLAFTGNYAIQGNYDGYQVWDISNPSHPTLHTSYYCPASQSDVSVYKNLLFVSAEGQTGR